jgi:hypothetical protein
MSGPRSRLRAEAETRARPRFDLRTFHDRVLENGNGAAALRERVEARDRERAADTRLTRCRRAGGDPVVHHDGRQLWPAIVDAVD